VALATRRTAVKKKVTSRLFAGCNQDQLCFLLSIIYNGTRTRFLMDKKYIHKSRSEGFAERSAHQECTRRELRNNKPLGNALIHCYPYVFYTAMIHIRIESKVHVYKAINFTSKSHCSLLDCKLAISFIYTWSYIKSIYLWGRCSSFFYNSVFY